VPETEEVEEEGSAAGACSAEGFAMIVRKDEEAYAMLSLRAWMMRWGRRMSGGLCLG
jgi:hypothetical protein